MRLINFLVPVIISISPFISMAAKKEAKVYTKEDMEKELAKRVTDKVTVFKGKGIAGFARELIKKEQRLEKISLGLKHKEEQIKLSEAELDNRIDEFNKKQTKLIACIEDIDKKHSTRVGHMVEVVANMKPANAANVLSVQDSAISVQILGRLPAAKVSKIFNFMDKEISARLQKQYMNMKR